MFQFPMMMVQPPQLPPREEKIPPRVTMAVSMVHTFLEEMAPCAVACSESVCEPEGRDLDVEEKKVYVHALDVIDKFILGEIKVDKREKIEEGRIILCPLCNGGQVHGALACPLCKGQTKLIVMPNG